MVTPPQTPYMVWALPSPFVQIRTTGKVKRSDPTSWVVNLEEDSGENKGAVFKYHISLIRRCNFFFQLKNVWKQNVPYNPLTSNTLSRPGCSCSAVVIALFSIVTWKSDCYPGGISGQLQPSTFQEPKHVRTIWERNVNPGSWLKTLHWHLLIKSRKQHHQNLHNGYQQLEK